MREEIQKTQCSKCLREKPCEIFRQLAFDERQGIEIKPMDWTLDYYHEPVCLWIRLKDKKIQIVDHLLVKTKYILDKKQ